jgi:hypothetical protein
MSNGAAQATRLWYVAAAGTREITVSRRWVLRRALSVVSLALICIAARPVGTPPAIYDRDPQHLFNRLYTAIAVRTEGGTPYGADNSEPFGEKFDDPAKLIAVLDEFLEQHGEERASGDLQRALLLNDLWAAFDLTASADVGPDGAPLRRRLARVIRRLRLRSSQITGLPDNYLEAVRSARFARDFDPAHPEKVFLPPDLFDANGPWVRVGGDGRGAVATMHLRMLSGRSVFKVFIRCPGGRQATLSYLETLNLYRTPWQLRPAEITSATYPTGRGKVRKEPLILDPATPQFPAGTIVALARQMMVITDKLEPALTPVTQKVQFRVFREIGGPAGGYDPHDFSNHQAVYELVMRRHYLLTGGFGGLHSMAPDEIEFQLAIRPMVATHRQYLRGEVVLSTCAICHAAEGIFSVNTYTGSFPFFPGGKRSNPQLLPASTGDDQVNATVDWKTAQFNWGLLRGLLEAMN